MKYLVILLLIFTGCTAQKPIVKYIGSQEDEKAVVYGSVVVESQVDLEKLKDVQLLFQKKDQKEPVAISWSITKECQRTEGTLKCPIILKANPGEYNLKNIILKKPDASIYTLKPQKQQPIFFTVTDQPIFFGIMQFNIKDQKEYEFSLRVDPYSKSWFEKQYLIPLREKEKE